MKLKLKITDEEVLKAILVEVELDEREYCFDKSYCSDELWNKEHGNKTRQQGYDESMAWHKGLTLDELLEHYGDKYDYVLDRRGLSTQ